MPYSLTRRSLAIAVGGLLATAATRAQKNRAVTKDIRERVVRSFDHTPIPVWTSGTGPALLIVHGAAADHNAWEGMRPLLDSRLTVAIMDRRACFGNPLSTLDLEDELKDVAAVAQSLGGKVSVLGHSSGALCALGASVLIPNLSHLILYEPPLERDPHYAKALQKMNERLKAGDIDGVFDVWLEEYVGMPADLAESAKRSRAGADIRSFAEYLPREMASHLAWDFDPGAFSGMTAATTYFTGGSARSVADLEYDPFIALLKDVLPNFSVRHVPEGHFAHYLAPKKLARIIFEVLGVEG